MQINQTVGRRRKWTSEEDDTLRAAVSTHGRNWKLVAQQLGHRFGNFFDSCEWCASTRPAASCRKRYEYYLKRPIDRNKPWTQDDNRALLAAVAGWGKNWARISEQPQFRGRSSRALCWRWAKLAEAPFRRTPSFRPTPERAPVRKVSAKELMCPVAAICADTPVLGAIRDTQTLCISTHSAFRRVT